MEIDVNISDEQIINFLQLKDVNVKDFTIEKLHFYYKLYNKNDRELLCSTLYNELKGIGHILNESTP